MTAPRARACFAAHAAALAIYTAFWWPSLRRLDGAPPAPLDDVFIHFDFARSLAFGHPMEWIAGNGYSSGATSLLYPVVLAPGFLVGFRGERLAWFAALVGVVAIADLLRSLHARLAGAPAVARFVAPLLVLAVPFVDWSLVSGMETALFAAVLGRAIGAVAHAGRAPRERSKSLELRAGAWFAILYAVRPEAAALGVPLAIAVAHASRAKNPLPSLARALAPLVVVVASHSAIDWAMTSEAAPAGAVRKLLFTNPYASPPELAIEVVKNVAALSAQALDAGLGGGWLSLATPLLVLAAVIDPRTRRIAIALVVGAASMFGLAALNATARFQNLRYAAPSVLVLLAAAVLGAGALSRRGRLGRVTAGALFVVAAFAPSSSFSRQIDHFARASANIRDQQIEVAKRLAARAPKPRRVFVNDAGAIAYVAELDAIDGLGLGGFRRLPFARASVHGPAAVAELLHRLPPSERPDVLAVYPGWWRGLADVFGKEAFTVHLDDNVICGADDLTVFEADFTLLGERGDDAPADAIDELDTADLVDEAAHAYGFDRPHAGYAIGAVSDDERGARRWDGGRSLPEGMREHFRVRSGVEPGPATLLLRTDGGPAFVLVVEVAREGIVVASHSKTIAERAMGRFVRLEIPLTDDTRSGDELRLFARGGALRDFHTWLVRPTSNAR